MRTKNILTLGREIKGSFALLSVRLSFVFVSLFSVTLFLSLNSGKPYFRPPFFHPPSFHPPFFPPLLFSPPPDFPPSSFPPLLFSSPPVFPPSPYVALLWLPHKCLGDA